MRKICLPAKSLESQVPSEKKLNYIPQWQHFRSRHCQKIRATARLSSSCKATVEWRSWNSKGRLMTVCLGQYLNICLEKRMSKSPTCDSLMSDGTLWALLGYGLCYGLRSTVCDLLYILHGILYFLFCVHSTVSLEFRDCGTVLYSTLHKKSFRCRIIYE